MRTLALLSNKKLADPLRTFVFSVLSLILALIFGGIVIYFLGFSPIGAYANLFKGAFGGKYQLGETVIKAVPLILTGLSYATAKRCGLINLGAEGQLYIGALFATVIATHFEGLPKVPHVLFALVSAVIGGGLLGAVVTFLKVKLGASEIITTIMLNNIATNLVAFCVAGPIMDKQSHLPQSAQIFASAKLSRFVPATRLHTGLFVVMAAILFYYVLMWKTTAGYQMRVIGGNENAGRYAGMNIIRSRYLSMIVAGGFAGLGGAIEIMGVQFRLIAGFSSNYGFDGIAVALLGANTPLGITLSGVLFGALKSGSSFMEMTDGVPSSIVYMIQGFVILLIVGRSLFGVRNRRVKRGTVHE